MNPDTSEKQPQKRGHSCKSQLQAQSLTPVEAQTQTQVQVQEGSETTTVTDGQVVKRQGANWKWADIFAFVEEVHLHGKN